MRLVLSLILIALIWNLPAALGDARAPALTVPHAPNASLPQKAKFVCGDTSEGYRCRREDGAIRRGKMHKIPKSNQGGSSGSSGWTLWGNSDGDAPPPADASGAATAAPGSCPPNSERLGGHCIAYKQTCNRGLAANAPPQICRSAQEKLVCDFRQDGMKDCCCRTYSLN